MVGRVRFQAGDWGIYGILGGTLAKLAVILEISGSFNGRRRRGKSY